MRDRQYAKMGVPAVWTPAGGVGLPITVLARLGDQVAEPQGFMPMVNQVPSVRVRASEIVAAGAAIPTEGDMITVDGAVYCIGSAPRMEGQRRDEYLIELAAD